MRGHSTQFALTSVEIRSLPAQCPRGYELSAQSLTKYEPGCPSRYEVRDRMSAEVRPWDPFLCESAKMVCTNRLDLVPARTLLDALYHQTSFITIRCFLETQYRSMSYITTFGMLAIDVRSGTSFLLKDHLEDAFSARAWTKSDIGPRCPDWA